MCCTMILSRCHEKIINDNYVQTLFIMCTKALSFQHNYNILFVSHLRSPATERLLHRLRGILSADNWLPVELLQQWQPPRNFQSPRLVLCY